MYRSFHLIIIIQLLVTTPFLFAMDWPSSGGRISGNFGWNEDGLPLLGVSIENTQPVNAAEDGELLYRSREGYRASRLPSPLGAWTALDHGDGIISIYSRYDGSAAPALPGRVEKGTLIGESGTSGWSSQSGLFFQLFDRRERRWINPSLIIIPLPDNRPPLIRSVRLMDDQGNLFDPSQIRNLSQGRYTVFVDAVDTMMAANERPLAPHRIICSLNGSEAGILNFETYSARDGRLMVQRNGLVPVRQVYAAAPSYEVADVWFSRGQTTLEIIVQDIAGNSRNAVYRFTVE